MFNYFSLENIIKELDITSLEFKNDSNQIMKINLLQKEGNHINLQITFFDDKNELIEVNDLSVHDLNFFIEKLEEFIQNIKSKKHKNFSSKLLTDLISTYKVLSDKKFSISTFFSQINTQNLFLYTICTSFKYKKNTHLAVTYINRQNMKNIYFVHDSNLLIARFHMVSLKLVYKLIYLLNRDFFGITENILYSLRPIIIMIIFLFNLFVFFDKPFEIVGTDIILSITSIVFIPFSKFISKGILKSVIRYQLSRLVSLD